MTTAMGVQPVAARDTAVPAFVPHPLLRNGHLQTIMGRIPLGPRASLPSQSHEIEVDDGDRLVVFESIPPSWDRGGPSALLVHGLGGSARGAYVVRVAARLVGLGVRAVRMNLRGAGSGFGSARGFYHAGRTEDLRRAVVEWLAERGSGSPIGLVGFSLGANLVLKLAAEAAATPLAGLDCVLAANPPIDLAAPCCRQDSASVSNRLYDRNFVRQLLAAKCRAAPLPCFPDLGAGSSHRNPFSL